MELLVRRGAAVTYTDPYVPRLDHGGLTLESVDEASAAEACDCALIVTNHTGFDYRAIASRFPLIVDTRNALKGIEGRNIFRL
jgi:UDP-N-acetyl-D-glucosamine dehydrogenase